MEKEQREIVRWQGTIHLVSTENFPKNQHFLPSDTHTYVCISGGKKCLFFGNFGVLCFLETPVLRFALLSYYRWFARYVSSCHYQIFYELPSITLLLAKWNRNVKCHVKLELKKMSLQNVYITERNNSGEYPWSFKGFWL